MLNFKFKAKFWNWSSILKSKIDCEIEVWAWSQSLISKPKFDLKIESKFWNWSSMFKLKSVFEIYSLLETAKVEIDSLLGTAKTK